MAFKDAGGVSGHCHSIIRQLVPTSLHSPPIAEIMIARRRLPLSGPALRLPGPHGEPPSAGLAGAIATLWWAP